MGPGTENHETSTCLKSKTFSWPDALLGLAKLSWQPLGLRVRAGKLAWRRGSRNSVRLRLIEGLRGQSLKLAQTLNPKDLAEDRQTGCEALGCTKLQLGHGFCLMDRE